ncbi:excinuclease ABC subunit UvrA [Chitinivibrio alkaliphilus]|uniref:UvrABC system protein A n=1 Tax=Chitinivibrio alkaliphilus ACht1 TaxID=1313304 RepID=U7D705_9BACT|nr:excinuclease ABC subunit UvrA [Chitinivibrio alkaliphilus]ERP31728.1 excinuclease ABC subunit A [Chitinivibrio alkaliphilus ACht1]
MNKNIEIIGANEHNLKNVSVTIPRDSLTVISGLSGSGKSSLAFDTLYSEGQRRYVESLSSYARQFLGLREKPDVQSIEGLSPAISIEQKTTGHNPRSTVATITEIHDYLRLLYSSIGIPHCYSCGKILQSQTVQEICDKLMDFSDGTKFQLLAPAVLGKKGEHREVFEELRKEGFLRVLVDDTSFLLDESVSLEKNRKHSIFVVIDRLVVKEGVARRLTDSLETALSLSCNNSVYIDFPTDDRSRMVFSEKLACPDCSVSFESIEPRNFSFNSPFGACPKCNGLGRIMEVDPSLVVPRDTVSLSRGAIDPWRGAKKHTLWSRRLLKRLCTVFDIDMTVPWKELSKKEQELILFGNKGREVPLKGHRKPYEGVVPNLLRRYKETESEFIRSWIESYMSSKTCPTCQGKRLSKESLSVFVGGIDIGTLSSYTIRRVKEFFTTLELSPKEEHISRQILREIHSRLDFLLNVGLEYLSLNRMAQTLSGGEAQRIRLATQIGSRLTGVTYILDEPSIGLHPRDNSKLLATLFALRDLGNTLIVIEHDQETLERADWLIDIGPRAGIHGGEVVAAGTPSTVMTVEASLTGAYLSGKRAISLPVTRRSFSDKKLTVYGAQGNNLKHITASFPLGVLTCVTGISGSGKSTLVNQTLYPLLAREVSKAKVTPLSYERIEGVEHIDKVIDIDQSPIGRTPRSNPATYTKIFDYIRDLFAQLPESKMRGFTKGRFSFNVKGGRCEACKGDGVMRIEMNFLPDVFVECEVCHGKRYNRETLMVQYKGKSIADVLEMTVEEALSFFEAQPLIYRRLEVLERVGLGYIHLGQPATTLSGGEAQRIKLAAELTKVSTGKTLYILDEPTTGLHFEDIRLLLAVLQALVEKGNTVIIIEHNLDVIKCADHIIDIGPEGGEKGGSIVCSGTPEDIAACAESATGAYLAPLL